MDSTGVSANERCDLFQEIQCSGSDTRNSFGIYGTDVAIKSGKLDQNFDSSNKIKVSQISKFEWEEKYYLGNLVSCNRLFLAYVLKVKPNADETVRVVNYHTSGRHLIRGFKKRVEDISFESHNSNRLACIDSEGTVFVYDIYETDNDIKSKILLQVNRNDEIEKLEINHRIIWAPTLLVPLEESEPMLAVSFGSKAEVYNIEKIISNHSKYLLSKNDITKGIIDVHNAHSKHVTSLALSPDTKVLASCSEDGQVKFWGLNFEDTSAPSCLHEWEPHGGDPVTCLFFTDNLLVGDDDTEFWRFLITGTANNSVLKIWCAVKWECIQTVRFCYDSMDVGQIHPFMKAAIDLSAKYFILADAFRRVLYVLKLFKDDENKKLTFVSVSEFLLKEPLLSFSIKVAKDKKNCNNSIDDMDNDVLTNGIDSDELNNENDKSLMSYVNLFGIHKRALQKYSIKFKASSSITLPPPSRSVSSQEDMTSVHDGLSDITDISDITTASFANISSIVPEYDLINLPQNTTFENDSHFTAVTNADEMSDNSSLAVSPDLKEDNEEETLIDIKETNYTHSNSQNLDTLSSISDSVIANSFTSSIDRLNLDVSNSSPFDTSRTKLVNGFSSLDAIEKGIKNLHYPTVNDEKPSFQSDKKEILPMNKKEEQKSVNIFSTSSELRKVELPSFSIAPKENEKPVECETIISTDVDSSLKELISLVKQQQNMINSQQEELRDIKETLKQMTTAKTSENHQSNLDMQDQIENDRDDMKVFMQLLQKNSKSDFSKASKEFNKLCMQRLEQFTTDVNAQSHIKDERVMQQLSNIVSNTISIKLEKTIKNEMKQTVLSGLEKMFARYLENSSKLIAEKLSVWERTLREETKELIKSKPLVESIGYAGASILEATIPNAYRESFQNVLLPGFQKASMAMFTQINQTFQQGTKQYLERLEKHLESKQQSHQTQKDPLISSLQDLVNSFQGTADRLTSGVEANLEALMQKQLRDATERLQGNFTKMIEHKIVPTLTHSVTTITEDAFSAWKTKIDESLSQILLKNSSGNVSSTESQEESLDSKKSRILRCLSDGDYHNAFEIALTARNVSLVTFLCQQIDPTELFQDSSNMGQSIILSLIQQLSINITDEMELKTSYLEESIMALKPKDEITGEHMPSVLEALNEQLQSAIATLTQAGASVKRIKPLKMLLMVSKQLLHGD